MRKNKVKPDPFLKEFWRDNERFADLFNTVMFHGEGKVEPKKLKDMDTDLSSVINRQGYLETLSKTRDVIKKSDGVQDYVILGIESQMEVHYVMPLRVMLYDALNYLKEVELLKKKNKGEKGFTKAEFLSGIKKTDKLHPVITIVIYYGEKEWDGPTSLKEMMIEMPESFSHIFSDYKMNLFQLIKSENYTFQNEEVQTVFEVSRYLFSGEYDKLQEKYNRGLPQEIAVLVGLITGSEELVDYSVHRKVEVNMCEALEQLKNKSLEQGIEKGIEQGMQLTKKVFKLHQKGDSLEKIAKECNMSVEKIKEILE